MRMSAVVTSVLFTCGCFLVAQFVLNGCCSLTGQPPHVHLLPYDSGHVLDEPLFKMGFPLFRASQPCETHVPSPLNRHDSGHVLEYHTRLLPFLDYKPLTARTPQTIITDSKFFITINCSFSLPPGACAGGPRQRAALPRVQVCSI